MVFIFDTSTKNCQYNQRKPNAEKNEIRSGLKTDTSQMTPIFERRIPAGKAILSFCLSERPRIAQLFRGQINATSGEKRKSDEDSRGF